MQEGSTDVECRFDWHQTATHVVIAIYCKNYHPDTSYVEVSPVRLKVHAYFPEQGGSFNLDIELAGVSFVQNILMEQCDQIWRNFATLTVTSKSLPIF